MQSAKRLPEEGADSGDLRLVKPGKAAIPGIVALWRKTYKLHNELAPDYYEADEEQLQMELTRYLNQALKLGSPHVRVALDSRDQVVGFIIFEAAKESYFDTKIREFGLVSELFVDESARRHKVGVRLMAVADEWFLKQGLAHVKVVVASSNEGALRFYGRQGFHDVQRSLFKQIK